MRLEEGKKRLSVLSSAVETLRWEFILLTSFIFFHKLFHIFCLYMYICVFNNVHFMKGDFSSVFLFLMGDDMLSDFVTKYREQAGAEQDQAQVKLEF